MILGAITVSSSLKRLVSYCATNSKSYNTEPQLAILAISPMGKQDENDGEDAGEATTFNALSYNSF